MRYRISIQFLIDEADYVSPINPTEMAKAVIMGEADWPNDPLIEVKEYPQHITLTAKDFKPEIPGSFLEAMKLTYRDLNVIHSTVDSAALTAKAESRPDIVAYCNELAGRIKVLLDLLKP